jgi:hypothetical protein
MIPYGCEISGLAESLPSLLTADFADGSDITFIRVIGVIRG